MGKETRIRWQKYFTPRGHHQIGINPTQYTSSLRNGRKNQKVKDQNLSWHDVASFADSFYSKRAGLCSPSDFHSIQTSAKNPRNLGFYSRSLSQT